VQGAHVERELALVKVIAEGKDRVEVLRVADEFRARIMDSTKNSYVFEITGTPQEIDTFINLLKSNGLVELCRTGSTAISRGVEVMSA